jgi:hypothetical protein
MTDERCPASGWLRRLWKWWSISVLAFKERWKSRLEQLELWVVSYRIESSEYEPSPVSAGGDYDLPDEILIAAAEELFCALDDEEAKNAGPCS